MPINLADICTCGRVGTHCRTCGSRSVYAKKFRSMEFSAALGRQVTVYGCRVCQNESNETEPCSAPSRTKEKTDFKVPQQEEIRPKPGTTAHYKALSEWILEKQQEKGMDRIKVYVEAQRAGWHLEAYQDIDEDVKQALIDRELWPQDAKEGDVSSSEKSQPVSNRQESSEPSLDEIIKAMQEEQK